MGTNEAHHKSHNTQGIALDVAEQNIDRDQGLSMNSNYSKHAEASIVAIVSSITRSQSIIVGRK